LTVVGRVLYVVGLAAFVATNVAALSEFHGRVDVCVISLAVLVAVVLAQSRRFESQSRDREYRRQYESSRDATYSALYGAVIHLGYRVTAQDPAAGTLQFRTRLVDLWIAHPSLQCAALVRDIDVNASEIVVGGQADLGARREDRHRARGPMRIVATFPSGLGPAANRILDRVSETVVTHAVLDSAAPLGDTRQSL
jgi:hypothetical protein